MSSSSSSPSPLAPKIRRIRHAFEPIPFRSPLRDFIRPGWETHWDGVADRIAIDPEHMVDGHWIWVPTYDNAVGGTVAYGNTTITIQRLLILIFREDLAEREQVWRTCKDGNKIGCCSPNHARIPQRTVAVGGPVRRKEYKHSGNAALL